jgi:hypothetical protein
VAVRGRPTLVVLVLFSAALSAALAAAFSIFPDAHARADETAEEGTFRLHKFEQPIGQESYAIKKDGDELQLSVSFHFNDRGQDVPLSAFVRLSKDLTPRSMEIHGEMARSTPIDDTVLVEKDRILARKNEEWRTFERPDQFLGSPPTLRWHCKSCSSASGKPPDGRRRCRPSLRAC